MELGGTQGWPLPAGATDAAQVWLQLIGEFGVRRGGRPVSRTDVGSRKARTLLALLALRRGRSVSVERIAEALWPHGEVPRRPAGNVATLVSRLRAALGAEVVGGGRDGYRLDDSVGDDLHTAAKLVARAESQLAGGQPTPALASAERALAFLGAGEVLSGEPALPWVDQARAWQVGVLRRGRHSAASAALRVGDLRTARAGAEDALAADPLDESAGRLLMRIHDAAAEPVRALLVYERLRATLASELGVAPAPATRDLHVAVLRGRTAPPAAGRQPVALAVGAAR